MVTNSWAAEEEEKEERSRKKFLGLAKEHPELTAKFLRYYKYHFDFTTEIDGVRWDFVVGEDSDDIYRFEVTSEMLVSEILVRATLQSAWEFQKITQHSISSEVEQKVWNWVANRYLTNPDQPNYTGLSFSQALELMIDTLLKDTS
jgi:hypothetical protein